MILDALFYLFYAILYGAISLLPSMSTFGVTWTNAWTFLANSFASMLYLLPTSVSSTVTLLLNLLLLFELTIFSFWLFDKVYGWIRG